LILDRGLVIFDFGRVTPHGNVLRGFQSKITNQNPKFPMLLYFYLLERSFFQRLMSPVIAESLRQRSFAPCVGLCRAVLERAPSAPADALVRAVPSGLSFHRDYWHGLIGECLVLGASDVPRLQTTAETLCCLLAPAHYRAGERSRRDFAPIQQAHLGTRDLVFGAGFYRPDNAGWNAQEDIERLLAYFRTIDPSRWQPEDLTPMPDFNDDAERAEEIAFARDWWPGLVEMYEGARASDWIVVCERA